MYIRTNSYVVPGLVGFIEPQTTDHSCVECSYVYVQESALRSRHITIVKKGWLSKGPDHNQDASIVNFSRVSVNLL